MDTIATTIDTNLISASGICKTYQQPDHAGRLVLDHILGQIAAEQATALAVG